MREKRESKAVAVALKETSVAASTTTSLAGAECKPSGPCSGGCACEADKAAAVVAQKQQQGAAEQEEDVAATGAEEAVVDVERLQKELLDLTETLLAEVSYPFHVTCFCLDCGVENQLCRVWGGRGGEDRLGEEENFLSLFFCFFSSFIGKCKCVCVFVWNLTVGSGG